MILLDRIAIDRVVNHVFANATVVQQSIPLAWGTIAGDVLSGTFGFDQELQQLALDFP